MIRALVTALLLTAPAIARASGDAHDGVALAGLATTLDGDRARHIAYAGLSGAGYAHAFDGDFAFLTYAWRSSALEAGWARRIAVGHRFDGWGALSFAAAPRGAFTAGPRALLALGGRFGDQVVWRPAVSASIAWISGPDTPRAILLPLEASLEVALRTWRLKPFLRLAAGADLLAALRMTGRGELAIGFAWPGE